MDIRRLLCDQGCGLRRGAACRRGARSDAFAGPVAVIANPSPAAGRYLDQHHSLRRGVWAKMLVQSAESAAASCAVYGKGDRRARRGYRGHRAAILHAGRMANRCATRQAGAGDHFPQC